MGSWSSVLALVLSRPYKGALGIQPGHTGVAQGLSAQDPSTHRPLGGRG